MFDCDHHGSLRYARRVFKNGTIHHCVQCSRCLKVVKTKRHGLRPFINVSEIPAESTVYPFVEADA